MAPFDYLPSTSSSVDLNNMLVYTEDHAPCLLLESFSSDSMATSSSGIPSFPLGCIAPLTTVVGLGSSLSMFPRGLPRVGGICRTDVMAKATLTIPTPPRLRTMLKEKLCVRKWAECLVVADAPGHIPWGNIGESPPLSWIPEGSSYPPEEFREALLNAHRPRQVRAGSVALNNSEELPLALNHGQYPNSASFHKPLVFEREITLGTADKRRRWSLQVPATSMNPEMVDMMLELRDLNTFFKGGLHDPDQFATSPDAERSQLPPPTLVVSSSSFALPISLESSGSLAPEAPLTLAARRGKRMPKALSLRKGPGELEYPDIPTPFLGSPSAYSPTFEFATGGPSMDLEEMVATLRASVPACAIEAFEAELMERNSKPSNFVSTTLMEEANEWAFADDLLKSYGDEIPSPDSLSTLKSRPSILLLLPQSSGDFESDSSANNLDMEPDANDETIQPRKKSWTIRRPQSPNILAPAPVLATRPPSTPLPPRPAITSPSSPRRVIGILKSCKSVRFASLPTRRRLPSPPLEPPSPARRDNLKTPSNASLRRPSPLRNSFAPPNVAGSPKKAATTTIPTRSTISRVAGRKGTPVEIESPASRLAPASRPLSDRSPLSPLGCQINPPKKFLWTASPGRHSLGGSRGDSTAGGIENRARAASSSCTGAPSRWSTLNENMRRRGSGTSLQDSGPQKSRMRVPLRNIFTRFK